MRVARYTRSCVLLAACWTHQVAGELATNRALRACAAWCALTAKTAGLHVLQVYGSRADPQDMRSDDEPIYETVKREHNWDPERCEPLSLTTLSVGRHLG